MRIEIERLRSELSEYEKSLSNLKNSLSPDLEAKSKESTEPKQDEE
jgi:hypothetical protein